MMILYFLAISKKCMQISARFIYHGGIWVFMHMGPTTLLIAHVHTVAYAAWHASYHIDFYLHGTFSIYNWLCILAT